MKGEKKTCQPWVCWTVYSTPGKHCWGFKDDDHPLVCVRMWLQHNIMFKGRALDMELFNLLAVTRTGKISPALCPSVSLSVHLPVSLLLEDKTTAKGLSVCLRACLSVSFLCRGNKHKRVTQREWDSDPQRFQFRWPTAAYVVYLPMPTYLTKS